MKKIILLVLILVVGIGIGFYIKTTLKPTINTSDKNLEVINSGTAFDLFKVYGPNSGADELEINFLIQIPQNISIIEKLNIIADRLSRHKFSYLPVTVVSVDEQEGKNIAMINLEENPWNRESDTKLQSGLAGMTWKSNFFQGTTGGSYTTQTLVQTFLQTNYQGDWIDGVRFLYEGESIEGWDHIQLKHTVYRKSM